ncbi:MAG: hypothetical protein NVSMB65_02720 [Chloroflexota bacterium]
MASLWAPAQGLPCLHRGRGTRTYPILWIASGTMRSDQGGASPAGGSEQREGKQDLMTGHDTTHDEDGSRRPARRGRADPHVHTRASDGLGTPEQLVETVARLDLDVVAVTDHDTVSGAEQVRNIVARGRYHFEVIVGIEVTTERGMHLLGLFVERPIRMFQSVERSIEAIVEQGGICLAPHPLSPLTPSLGRRAIERVLAGGYPLIGVEAYNPSPAGRVVERKIRAFNKVWGLAEFGGSDAHFLARIGTAYTEFDGHTAEDLRRSLLERTTTAHASTLPLTPVPLRDYVRQSGRSMILNPAQKISRTVGRHKHA